MEPLSLPFVVDPEGCSRAGAITAEGSASRQCMELLTAYQQYGPMNDRQAEAVTGIKDTTVCARAASRTPEARLDSDPRESEGGERGDEHVMGFDDSIYNAVKLTRPRLGR